MSQCSLFVHPHAVCNRKWVTYLCSTFADAVVLTGQQCGIQRGR